VLPNLPPAQGRHFFFDLVDPEKRSPADIKTALVTISKFSNHGHVTLSLNLKEAQQIYSILGNPSLESKKEAVERMAVKIRQNLGIETVVIHPIESAACATKYQSYWIQGPYCKKPLITTGAGDHFNAAYSMAQLIGMSPVACLTTAVNCSGYYVRTAKTPSIFDINNFIHTGEIPAGIVP
jgi:sugar/nucleoside kinase (ribokinase family)